MSSKEDKKYGSKMLTGENYKNKEDMIQSRDMYYPRDLSWLDFNRRVLYRCIDDRVPTLERLNFMNITTSNLDDFISARMSFLYNQSKNKPYETGISGLTYKDEFKITLKALCKFKHDQIAIYKKLLKTLEYHYAYKDFDDMDGRELMEVKEVFRNDILPLLYIVKYDMMTEEPMVRSGNLCVLNVAYKKNKSEPTVRFVEIPSAIPNFVWIAAIDRYVSLKDMIAYELGQLFDEDQKESYFFRVIREGYIMLSDDITKHIRVRVDDFCLMRSTATPIFIEIDKSAPKYVINILKKMFNLKGKFVYPTNVFGPSFHFGNYNSIGKHHLYRDYDYIGCEVKSDNSKMFFLPYNKYDDVINMLEDAAKDDTVTMICMTLYRVSGKDSPIIKALCDAARNKKRHVCVVLELRARTDEERNIELVQTLKKSGVQVVHGFEKLKTHAKMILIARNNGNNIHYTTLIATGNFNEKTAKIYSDVVYITENQSIGKDVCNVFNFIIAGCKLKPMVSNRIFISPYTIKSRILDEIENEIDKVRMNQEGKIEMKLNSISDYDIISKLYQASKEGVDITLYVRGVCSVIPNKRIHIKSIVGRYLEHSRIYKFGDDNYYITSADMLTRNLDKRVEMMVKIEEEEMKQFLDNILTENRNDIDNSFVLTNKGWKVVKGKESYDMFHSIHMGNVTK